MKSWNHRPTCDGIETEVVRHRSHSRNSVGITDLLAMGLRPLNAFPNSIDLSGVGITDLLAMGLRLDARTFLSFTFAVLESQTYLRWD